MTISRRDLLASAAAAVAAGATGRAQGAQPPADPTKVRGRNARALGQRASTVPTQRLVRGATSSVTPHQDLMGIITPSDLHFERHHGGVPEIDPQRYSLLVHGMVERPMVFALDDLKRFPSVSRIHFIECSGNLGRTAGPETTPGQLVGMTSTSEWTGVLLSTIFREVGVNPKATWFLAEGMDAASKQRRQQVATRFLIEVPHEEATVACARVVDVFLRTGSHFLSTADWGCKDGVHKAWMVVEVDSKDEARGIVPPAFRPEVLK